MIFFPSRGKCRVPMVERFIHHWYETEATLPVTLILDADDAHHYGDVELPANWIKRINPTPRKLNKCINDCFNDNPNEDFYGVVTDDCIPRTQKWDVELANTAGDKYIAWPDDGVHGPNMCGFSYIGGDLVRAWGWYCTPIVKRGCVDFIWGDFGDVLGLKRYRGDILLEHMHHQITNPKTGRAKADFDVTYATQPSVFNDEKIWLDYRKGQQFRDDVCRVADILRLEPDFTQLRPMQWAEERHK